MQFGSCLPRKTQNSSFKTENPTALVKKINEYFTSVGRLTAQKACDLAAKHNFDICPTVLNVDSMPDQCMEGFQFGTVSDKDVECVVKSSLHKCL